MVVPKDADDLIARCQTALAEGDFRVILSIATKRYLEFATDAPQQQQQIFLGFIKVSAEALIAECAPDASKEETCSFCCNPLGDLFHVRAHEAVICERCIRAVQTLLPDNSSPEVR